MVFLGCLAGPIFDLGYARQLLWVGSMLIVVGTITQSLSDNLWQLLLSQGLCIGFGMGSLAVLGVAVLSPWFSTRLPVANGIAAAGSGVGGYVLALISQRVLFLVRAASNIYPQSGTARNVSITPASHWIFLDSTHHGTHCVDNPVRIYRMHAYTQGFTAKAGMDR